ncbi:MAG: type IX secretion system membrane protein PorP/SprF [Saprospiraceae bacterium]
MKNIILLIAFLATAFSASAQYEAVFSHYNVSPILVNPSFAGYEESHRLQLNLRNQWTGFTNAPTTYAVSYNGPIGKTLGLGVGVLSESIANITRYRFQLNYAFRYEIQDVKVAAGFSTEFQKFQLANSILENRLYQPGDFAITDAVDGRDVFDASVGVYARIKDATFIGFAIPNLISERLADIGGLPTANDGRQFIFNFGHEFDLEAYNVKIEPSLMVRKVQNVPILIDFNLIGKFLDERLHAGLTYRAGTGGAVGIMLGTQVSNINIFYSYEVFFGAFQQFNSGTHEVTVAFDFGGNKETRFDRNTNNYRN